MDKRVFVLFVIFFAASADQFSDGILNIHNILRAKYGIAALTWDAKAAQVAQNYANVCIVNSFLTSAQHPKIHRD